MMFCAKMNMGIHFEQSCKGVSNEFLQQELQPLYYVLK